KLNALDSRLRGNDEVEVTRNLKQAKPNEPDSHFRGNDGIYVGMTGYRFPCGRVRIPACAGMTGFWCIP
ncbi:hypothetical protein, partial [Neisseria meningitidis]|uniref:hypothetical protein n=1 Tax=Neisseria meningitidis TaxID=487 RepID=UPI0021A448F0